MKVYFQNSLKLFKMFCAPENSLHFSIPIGKLCYEIYECPGLWLSDKKLDALVEDLVEVARKCQGTKDVPIYGVLTGDREDLSKRLITIAYDRKTKEPLGFAAQIYLDLKDKGFKQRILHLGLIFVDKSTRGKNISYLLTVFPNILITIKNGFHDIWVSNVSQVPAVVGLVDQNYRHVYPGIKGKNQKFFHRKLSSLMIKDHHYSFGVGEDANYNVDKQVIENAYTGGSDNLKKKFSEAPKHRIEGYNDLCERDLDYDRGDDFLQLGVLSAKGFIDLFKKKMSNANKITIAVLFFVMSTLSILILVYRWVHDGITSYQCTNKEDLIL